LLSFLALTVLALVLAACAGAAQPAATPAPSPVPATDTPAAAVPATPATPVPAEDAWERIQAAGRIVVGTSADYPPFESYDDNFRIVGFDIALIDQIAGQLGLEVDVKDIAFDGLADALDLGQIDAAIAAISVTPQREEAVDFSQIYFVSVDAYLAAASSNVADITSLRDLAPYRVGVQRGSVFQDWLEDELIATGIMPDTDLFLYGQIEEGFKDLEQGRVDLLVMDRQPALAATESQGFRLVGEGLNRERYAIAVAKGQNTLRTRLNQALLTLQDQGAVANLAKQYLDLDPSSLLPVPTATPEQPTATPAPQQPTATPVPGCQDGAAYVSDLNLDDQNMQNPPIMSPGQLFRKGWRLLNTGTCTWNSSYTLNFVQGNKPGAQMGGQPTAVQGSVAPGQTYDMYVDLVAPLQAGTYQAFWQLTNGQGKAFGERVYVGIAVPAGPTPTPAPTQTPVTGIQFYTDRDNINSGECTVNHWRTQNVQAVYYYREGQNWENNGVAGVGDRQECPAQTTKYYLRVVKRDNSVETRELTVRVNQTGNPPTISRFTVDPSGQVPAGTCVTLRWKVDGNVSRVVLNRNNAAVWDGAPFRGNYQDCPTGTGDTTYTIEASGPGGTSRAVEHVYLVQGQPTATPQPTGVPEPRIDAFTVNPGQIDVNQCVTVAWSTSGGTSSVRLLRDGSVIQDNAGLSGSLQDCLSQPGRANYRLEARNGAGSTVTADAGVDVNAPQQPTATPVPPTPTPQPQAPVINFFSADPNQIEAGQCVILAWSFTGQDLATSTITRDGQTVASDVPLDGSQEDCPPGAGTVTYTLRVDAEFGGSAQQSSQVNVVEPQPEVQPPQINSFTANPPQVDLNNTCTSLEWSISGEGIAAVTLLRNGQQIAGPDVASGYQDCVDPSLAGQELIYRLRVDAEFADPVRQELTVPFIAG
jgi:polar amino acid transport system substrate-binding protein